MNITHEIQDLTYLSWTKIRNSSGMAGSFLKSYSVSMGTVLINTPLTEDELNSIVLNDTRTGPGLTM